MDKLQSISCSQVRSTLKTMKTSQLTVERLWFHRCRVNDSRTEVTECLRLGQHLLFCGVSLASSTGRKHFPNQSSNPRKYASGKHGQRAQQPLTISGYSQFDLVLSLSTWPNSSIYKDSLGRQIGQPAYASPPIQVIIGFVTKTPRPPSMSSFPLQNVSGLPHPHLAHYGADSDL